ncbi:MAG: hypothetical protein M3Y54_06985 [Bacteroidota bacterium]|nr:hypothetical protein [Bacteroidota bacterium]
MENSASSAAGAAWSFGGACELIKSGGFVRKRAIEFRNPNSRKNQRGLQTAQRDQTLESGFPQSYFLINFFF